MRQVIKTKVEEFGPFIRHWRFYDDGAWALRSVKSDKTVKTIFTDGKGHWFEKHLESGWDIYININVNSQNNIIVARMRGFISVAKSKQG